MTELITTPAPRSRRRPWLGLAGVGLFIACLICIATAGLGVEGGGNSVTWSYAEASFRWWLGIAVAGTLTSAGLLLWHQSWRTNVHRAADAASVLALALALAHRPWLFTWVIHPEPDSPLMWSAAGLWSYAIVSVLYAAVDLQRGPMSSQRWSAWRGARTVLAALALVTALGAQTLVSFETATSLEPLWHSTLAPESALAAGALGGFAVLALVARAESNTLCKLALGAALGLTWCTVVNHFTVWYAGGALLPTDPVVGSALAAACLLPHLLWFRRARESVLVPATVAAAAWLFVLVKLTGPARVMPSPLDAAMLLGALMLFATALRTSAQRDAR